MSLIEEALRRVQEVTPPTPAARRVATATAIEEAPAVSQPAAPSPAAPIRQPQGGTIPPALPSPITISGLGMTAVSVGLLVVVSALTLRHPISASLGRRAIQARSAPASAAPEPAVAPAPAAAAPVQPSAPDAAAPAHASVVKPNTVPLSAGDPVMAVPGFEAPQFILNGIVRGSGEPVAIINGRILRVGETIAGATLSDIMSEAARLRWPDRELIIRITR